MGQDILWKDVYERYLEVFKSRRVLNVENIKAGIYIVNGRKILIK